MQNLLTLSITFALSQVVLSALLLLGRRLNTIQERLFAILLLAITGYLLSPLTAGTALHGWMGALSTAVPGMFWLFSASLFDDHFYLRRWQITLVAVTVVAPVIQTLLEQQGIGGLRMVLVTLPQLLEFVLLGLTLLVAARYWRADLIESRRSLRLWFCGLNGIYIFVLIFVREVVVPEVQWLDPLQYLPVGGILLATNALLLEYKLEIMAPRHRSDAAGVEQADPVSAPEPEGPAPAFEVPEAVLRPLQQLMEEQHYYKKAGLTISQLGRTLDLPDHRLRQIINTGLGYRNFRDFLNSYRIREASRALADPAQSDLPVLTVALEAGFNSLSSFNKAFRDTHQTTPTAYRRQHLGEGAAT